MAWKIVFRPFFHREYIKDNLQTELSCGIKCVQSHFQEFLEYEKWVGYLQKVNISPLQWMRSCQVCGWDLAECEWDPAECKWDLAECGWVLAECGWVLADCGWDLAECAWMRSSRVWMKSSREWMRSSRVWMRFNRVRVKSSWVLMRSRWVWKIYSPVKIERSICKQNWAVQ